MSDIYKTPAANLQQADDLEDQFGSIERGLKGDYQFSIRAVLSEAWEKVSGCKGTFALAMLIYFAFLIGISIVFQIIIGIVAATVQDNALVIILSIVDQIVIMLVTTPLFMGMIILGMRRSAGAPLRASSILNYFGSMLSLFFTIVLMYLLIIIGLMLLVLPGIYLMVAYYMALPLVAEKGMGPWQALETSRKVVSKKWFRLFFFGIVMMIIMLVSMIPLGIGLIWTGPMMMIAYGIIYRNMFGIRKETLAG